MTPPPPDWARVRALFFAAHAAGAPERARLLADSAEDAAVRAYVARMLDADAAAGARLETPAFAALHGPDGGAWPDPPSLAGRQLGPYRVRRRVGQGGMGAVYEAERVDGAYDGRVAVKTLWRGADSAVLARRFRSERQILAGLRHPHIAGLLDGGATEEGTPYLVMEFVDGRPIDAYCDERRLGLPARLDLFRQVCAAVAHAHRHLVVHRDLKPANVLVTDDGAVKLLDFGVAKLVADAGGAGPDTSDPGSGDGGTLTGAGLAPFTAAYAAPEQLAGGRVSTATDVYALGALLTALVAGRPPFAVEGLSAAEALWARGRAGPAAPSALALAAGAPHPAGAPTAAAARGFATAAQHARALRGELDAIAGVALRDDPARRYATVDALADDVRRYLRRDRVLARPDTVGYRVRAFARRQRALAAGVGVAAAALVAGSAVALWEARAARAARREAEARYGDVRALAGSLLFDAYDASVDVAGTTVLQATLAERARAHLDRLAAGGRRDPLLDRQLALAYRRLGDVRGNPTKANRGDPAGARAAYGQGLALARRAARALPGDTSLPAVAATLLERLADVEAALGDPAAARARTAAAVAEREGAARRAPTSVDAAQQLVVAVEKLGDVSGHPAFVNVGQPRAARAAYERALALLAAPPLAADTTFATRRHRALVRERLGRMLQVLGEPRAARDTLRRSLALRDRVLASRPASVDARRDVAIAHFLLGDVLLEQGDVRGAAAQADTALPIRLALARADTGNVMLVRGVALTLGQVARVRRAAGDAAGARRAAGASLAEFARYLRGRAPNAADAAEVARVRAVLAPAAASRAAPAAPTRPAASP